MTCRWTAETGKKYGDRNVLWRVTNLHWCWASQFTEDRMTKMLYIYSGFVCALQTFTPSQLPWEKWFDVNDNKVCRPPIEENDKWRKWANQISANLFTYSMPPFEINLKSLFSMRQLMCARDSDSVDWIAPSGTLLLIVSNFGICRDLSGMDKPAVSGRNSRQSHRELQSSLVSATHEYLDQGAIFLLLSRNHRK